VPPIILDFLFFAAAVALAIDEPPVECLADPPVPFLTGELD